MNIVVIGAQWGDEGKGKIVDYLAAESDIIVRFSGGANAGHTIVTGEEVYKLHLVPSGVIYPGKTVILGTGMVVDPKALFDELDMLRGRGIDWTGRVLISDRAHVVLQRYKRLDTEAEGRRRNPIGTTGRGIGITYAMKAHREGVRIGDILEESVVATLDEEDRDFLKPYIERLRPLVVDIAPYLAANRTKHILYEGAQGVLLDLDVGTYPYVSSGYSAAAGASLGGGIGPRAIDRVLGVFKAYTTRVGNGPFPTEFRDDRDGDLATKIREIGHEYGTTTGRPRRCGYLDLVALRYACRTNSIDSLVLTHLDIYDSFEEIKACVAYEYRGKPRSDFPASIDVLSNCDLVTRTFKGWNRSIGGSDRYEDLPPEAKDYIRFIEEFTETNVDVVSVGNDRKQTMVRRDLWKRS